MVVLATVKVSCCGGAVRQDLKNGAAVVALPTRCCFHITHTKGPFNRDKRHNRDTQKEIENYMTYIYISVLHKIQRVYAVEEVEGVRE